MQTEQTQVVIIGGGPTGLSMAVQLQRYNIRFIILEQQAATTRFSKALVVQARTLEIFQEAGLSDAALAEGKITRKLNAYEGGKKKFEIPINNLGQGISPFPYALSLEQSATETILVEWLENNGQQVRWKSRFINFQDKDNKVNVYYEKDGQECMIVADYMVAADGAASPARHQMNLPLRGDTITRNFYVCDIRLRSTVITEDELYMFLIRKGFILFFPMRGEGHYRIIGIIPSNAGANPTFEALIPGIKEAISVPVDFEPANWFSTYKVHSRKADSFSSGRCFLAGDAAHIHTPAGGQGMNTGIQDTYNLAWKLAFTLQYKLKRALLDSYTVEREQNARNLLRTTDRAFDMMAGSTAFLDFLRLRVAPLLLKPLLSISRFKKRIFPLISQTSITYHDSAIVIPGRLGKVTAGVRMPWFLTEDGSSVYDKLRDTAFKIIFFGKQEPGTFDGLHAGELPVVKLLFSKAPEVFGKQIGFYVLLRPDNHIAYLGPSIEKCNEIFSVITP